MLQKMRMMVSALMLVSFAAFAVACTPTNESADNANNDVESTNAENPNAEANNSATDSEGEENEEASGNEVDEADPDDMAVTEPGELGVVEVPAGDPIRIASLFVLSGENEALGRDSLDGVEIAVDDMGEVLGHSVEVDAVDSQCSPEGGQTAASKVAADPTIAGVIGTSCSSAAEAAIPVITEAGLVMLSASNTAPSLTAADRSDKYAGYLRTAHNDLFQGAVAAEYAYNELGVANAATIHDGSAYAEQLARVFADRFVELGGVITTEEAVNEGDTDMGPVLLSISATSPELIYYPIFTDEGGFVTSQARETEGLEEVVLMGADGMFSQDFVDASGEAANGVYLSGPYVSEGGDYQDFLDKVQEKYNRGTKSGFHAHAYDAAMILLNAISLVAVDDGEGNLTIDKQALRDAVFATENYQGLTGTLTCNGPDSDSPGDCATGEALAVFQLNEETIAGDWPPSVVYQPGE